MIKINNTFSIERDLYGWTLYHTYKTEYTRNEETVTGFKTSKSYYPKLHDIIDEIFDRVPMDCESLVEVHNSMKMIKADVFRAIMGCK